MNAAADTLHDRGEAGQTSLIALSPGLINILSGAQQGASTHLKVSEALTLGSSLENDIVLRDSSVEPQQMMLILDADVIQLQCLSGSVLVDGMPLLASESTVAHDSALIQIGSVALSVSCPGKNSEPVQSDHDTVPGDEDHDHTDSAQAAPAFFMPQNETSSEVEEDPAQHSDDSTEHGSSGKAVFLTLAALSLGAVVVWQSGLFSKNADEAAYLSDLLAASPFAELIVEQQGNEATVSGYIDSVQDSIQLDLWLKQSGLLINNEVLVGETLGEQVADVFRVNGVNAEVDVSEGGNVTVITQEPDSEFLNVVEERVLADVPRVASLRIDNTPPPVAAKVDPAALADPGKRVALVVSDVPSYIVTEDQSRYFIGSLLPTGHKIFDIKDGKVSLEKQGVITTLEF